ncbi:hypothetical protein NOR53_2140 [gamma proteobacterium NOR5-3]|nr:hypothetical protein NOR53_2140 [gamma proteobacterium NOR5-3]
MDYWKTTKDNRFTEHVFNQFEQLQVSPGTDAATFGQSHRLLNETAQQRPIRLRERSARSEGPMDITRGRF